MADTTNLTLSPREALFIKRFGQEIQSNWDGILGKAPEGDDLNNFAAHFLNTQAEDAGKNAAAFADESLTADGRRLRASVFKLEKTPVPASAMANLQAAGVDTAQFEGKNTPKVWDDETVEKIMEAYRAYSSETAFPKQLTAEDHAAIQAMTAEASADAPDAPETETETQSASDDDIDGDDPSQLPDPDNTIVEGDEPEPYANGHFDPFRAFEDPDLAENLASAQSMGAKPITIDMFRMLSVRERMSHLMHDPRFLDAIDGYLKQNPGMTRQDLAAKGRVLTIKRKVKNADGIETDVEEQVNAQDYMFELLKENSPIFAKPGPDGKIGNRGFVAVDFERHYSESYSPFGAIRDFASPFIGATYKATTFIDARGHRYRCNNHGIQVRRASKKSGMSGFDAAMALNVMDLHVAQRHNHHSSMLGKSNTVVFRINSGRAVKMGRQHRKNTDMLILSALDAADKANVNPDIRVMGPLGYKRITNFDLARMSPDALVEMRGLLGEARLEELCAKFSTGVGNGPSVDGDIPSKQAPESHAERAIDMLSASGQVSAPDSAIPVAPRGMPGSATGIMAAHQTRRAAAPALQIRHN